MLRITARGLRKCSSNYQIKVCSINISQGAVVDLEAKIQDLEEVLRKEIRKEKEPAADVGIRVLPEAWEA
jgi:hypothetical protein